MKQAVIGILLVIALFTPLVLSGSVGTTTAEELPSMMATSEADRADALQASMQAQPVDDPDIIVMEKVQENPEYLLPYPGILPDHALYPLKLFRDRLLGIFIRDPQRKIEFNLLMADKRLNMGVFLAEKGKYELAAETVSHGQKYFIKGTDLISELHKQDKSLVAKSTIDTYQIAANKHLQVVRIMKNSAPENLLSGYNELTEEAEGISQKLGELAN